MRSDKLGMLASAMAIVAASGARGPAISISEDDLHRGWVPPLGRGFSAKRYRPAYTRPAPGTKVARALGHDGAIYHTGALNKDDRASVWARGWNRSEGTYAERIAATRRYVEYCFGAGR